MDLVPSHNSTTVNKPKLLRIPYFRWRGFALCELMDAETRLEIVQILITGIKIYAP
jgi:hypothetical protein